MNISVNANKAGGFSENIHVNAHNKSQNQGRKSLYLGDTSLADNPIAQRRKQAQKQAMKVVRDAWENDMAVSKSVEDRRAHYQQMEAQKEEAQKQAEQLSNDEKTLQEQYAVAPDSQEQQDLEVLKKFQDYNRNVTSTPLTKEESERVDELLKHPLTEYQQRALELNKRAGDFKKDAKAAYDAMKDDVSDIRSILQEKLKSNPMLDAQKAEEDIWGATNDDILGLATQEAMDHIEEENKKREEESEKAAEKKEEKEEQLEKVQEGRAYEQAIMEGTKEALDRAEARARQNDAPDMNFGDMYDVTKMNQQTTDMSSSLNDIKNSMKLLEADLKGIQIDEEA